MGWPEEDGSSHGRWPRIRLFMIVCGEYVLRAREGFYEDRQVDRVGGDSVRDEFTFVGEVLMH